MTPTNNKVHYSRAGYKSACYMNYLKGKRLWKYSPAWPEITCVLCLKHKPGAVK